MASNHTTVAYFELFPSDRDLLESAELFRTWLIETNPLGDAHAQFLRSASIGTLIKMMAKDSILAGGRHSMESLADGIALARLTNAKHSKGGTAA